MLKGQDQDWITGFKVYLTDNQKLTQKKILLKKKKINKNSDTRIYPVSRIIDRLVDCIFSKKETYPNFKDGYRTQYLVENAIKSHKYKSKWIKLQN